MVYMESQTYIRFGANLESQTFLLDNLCTNLIS